MVQLYAHLAPEHLAKYADQIAVQKGKIERPHIIRHTVMAETKKQLPT